MHCIVLGPSDSIQQTAQTVSTEASESFGWNRWSCHELTKRGGRGENMCEIVLISGNPILLQQLIGPGYSGFDVCGVTLLCVFGQTCKVAFHRRIVVEHLLGCRLHVQNIPHWTTLGPGVSLLWSRCQKHKSSTSNNQGLLEVFKAGSGLQTVQSKLQDVRACLESATRRQCPGVRKYIVKGCAKQAWDDRLHCCHTLLFTTLLS